ncbi:hypothetical protein LOTGIDRAFT_122747, partial [Lottia gigantea]
EEVKLKKNIGLLSGISVIVGTIIGSGIFLSPKGVVAHTGSVALGLIVWVAAGLIAMMGGLCYAELGTLLPQSGGEYVYIKEAMGVIPAFLFAWTAIIVSKTSQMAIIVLTFAAYAITLFDMCGVPALPQKLIAAIGMLSVGIINSFSTKLATRVQIVFTVAKLSALIIIIIGGFVRIAEGKTDNLSSGFEGTTNSPSSIALSIYHAMWAYEGWNNLNYVTEELKDPAKNLPRSNLIGMVIVIIVYSLANMSYLTVMTIDELLDSPAVAVTWAERVLGPAQIIIPLSVMISAIGAVNGLAFSGTRVVFAAGRDGVIPEVLSYIHIKNYTPMPSMIFTIFVTLIFVFVGDISGLIDLFSFAVWMFYFLTFVSLLILRYTKRNTPRTYKVPIAIPIALVLIAGFLLIAPIIEHPRIEFLYAFVFVIGGLIFYIPLVHFNLKLKFMDSLTMYLQLLLEVVPSTK